MSISQNGKFAGWIEEFVSALSKTASNDIRNENEEELVVEADINIDDLDEIIWNEEKYRVMFDENGANIINEFGNTVTTLEGVKTLEEVNQRLSEKQIVVNSAVEIPNEIEEEINKAMKYIEDPEFNKLTSEKQAVEEPEIVVTKEADIIEEPEIIIEKKNEEKEKVEAAVKKFEVKASKILNKKVAEMEEQLSESLDEKISAMIESKIDFMVEQILAKVTEGLSELNIFNSQDIKDMEKQQYDKSANDTMETINNENDADRTTPEGFFKNYDNNEQEDEELYNEEDKEEPIIDNLEEDQKDEELVESPIEKDEPKFDLDKELDMEDKEVDEKIEEEPMVNDLDNEEDEMELEASAEEDPKEYLNKFRKHKNIKDLRCEKIAEDNGMDPANIEDYNPSGQSQPEEPQQSKDPQQEMQDQQDNIQNVQASVEDEEEIVGSDAEMFKTAICPFCANKLNTESKDGEFLNISCGSCNTKYKVNLNDERIYIR